MGDGPLPLYVSDGSKTRHSLADPRLLGGQDDLIDVFVGSSGLLGQTCPGSGADIDVPPFHLLLELLPPPDFRALVRLMVRPLP